MCSSNAVHYIGFTLGGGYAHFELDKASFVLGNELWEEHFESFLFTKEFTLDIREERKCRLYGNVCDQQLHPQSPTWFCRRWDCAREIYKPGTGKLYSSARIRINI